MISYDLAHHQTGYDSGPAPVVWVGGYPAALPGPSHHSDCYMIDSVPVVWVGGYPAAPSGPSHHSDCYMIDPASPDVRMSEGNLLILNITILK